MPNAGDGPCSRRGGWCAPDSHVARSNHFTRAQTAMYPHASAPPSLGGTGQARRSLREHWATLARRLSPNGARAREFEARALYQRVDQRGTVVKSSKTMHAHLGPWPELEQVEKLPTLVLPMRSPSAQVGPLPLTPYALPFFPGTLIGRPPLRPLPFALSAALLVLPFPPPPPTPTSASETQRQPFALSALPPSSTCA